MPNECETAPLSEAELRDLRVLVAMMIPASAEFAVPGADDPAIFGQIVAGLGRDLCHARAVLRDLAARSGGVFAESAPAQQEQAIAILREVGGESLAVLHRVVLLCYYRDDRVLHSLDIEPRSPFPKGFTLEQGDWSLLDPVRRRPKLWRDAG